MSKITVIKNVKYFDGDNICDNSCIVVSGSKVEGIVDADAYNDIDNADEIIDGKGMLLTPGFIDIHIHGCGGYDVMDGNVESIDRISQVTAMNGTTSFLPTTVTMSIDSIKKAVSSVKVCMGKTSGANILGVHLEGPFINKERKGAQNEKYILEPSIDDFKLIAGDDIGLIKRVTLAPEMKNGLDLVKFLVEKNICVSAGHTRASTEVFNECASEGMKLCTHLFNGMDPLHHRGIGVVGSALMNDDIYTEFIADLKHINKDALEFIFKLKGEDKCILISDAMSAACMGEGIFSLGGLKVIVRDGAAHVESGSLAGSIIMVKDAVKNMVLTAHIDLKSVLKMATVNPAVVIGVDGFKGRIKKGYDADLNILNEDLDVVMTMVMGKVIKNSLH